MITISNWETGKRTPKNEKMLAREYDRVLTEYFLFVELGQVIAITILIILAIIGYIQIKKEK